MADAKDASPVSRQEAKDATPEAAPPEAQDVPSEPVQGLKDSPPEPAAATGDNPERSADPPQEESAAEGVLREFASIKSRVMKLEGQIASSSGSGFFGVGLFFVVLGIGFLVAASRFMGSEHSSFSFVTVVLGIGILLYGTGSQGVGEYKANAPNAGTINVAIVGGAAVITFCVAFGMIYFQDGIKTAFQIERKYFVLRIVPNNDGSSKFDNYVAKFTMNGIDIPTMKSGRNIIVFVPYLESDKNSKPKIDYEFFHVGTTNADGGLDRTKPGRFDDIEIVQNKFPRKDAGLDFPIYVEEKGIDLRKAPSLGNVGMDPSQNNSPATLNVPAVVIAPEGRS